MYKNFFRRWQIIELPLSVLVFFLLVWFTYGILIKAPYSGFDFNPGNGQITQIFTDKDRGPSLLVGDVLVKVGPVLLEDFHQNRRLVFFENTQKGETVDIIVNRDGRELTIPWEFPSLNQSEFYGRFFNIWWLAYIFWLAGFAVQLHIRPKDMRWQLFIAANYLTAIWLILGSLSAWQLWESSILLHSVTWLLPPVYLHLHWVFPRPLGNMPKAIWVFIYVTGFSFAAGELIQILPYGLYAFAFLIALSGSVILEVVHFIKQEDQRRSVVMLTFSILIALAPSIGFGLIVAAGGFSSIGPLTLFALPFMPLAYIYIIYRRQLGGLELRANRIVSIYAFLILLGTLLLFVIMPISLLPIPNESMIFLVMLFSSLTACISILAFPVFQAFVEQRFLGIKLPYQNLQETYSSRITASTSLSSLLQLLNDEIFPSLLVRQFAFMQVFNGNLKALLTKNINQEQLPRESDMNELASQTGRYLPDISPDSGWVRLILPLKLGDNFIGLWLLGRRDPDDIYPQAEIPILQSLANQTAIALSNILHTEQLRKMYQSDIERYEKERMRLALELHDSILNELAVLRTNLDETKISPKFQTSYEELTRRLREIVSDLRPPMLMYGLVPAINELADNLMERNSDTITIKVDIQTSEERLPQNIEQHLFRIVQEACENALRHAQAKSINMFGALIPQGIELTIEDDGKGFDAQLDLSNLIVNNHFGLAGMIERAHLIGAEINIQSRPSAGTKVHIAWDDNTVKNLMT